VRLAVGACVSCNSGARREGAAGHQMQLILIYSADAPQLSFHDIHIAPHAPLISRFPAPLADHDARRSDKGVSMPDEKKSPLGDVDLGAITKAFQKSKAEAFIKKAFAAVNEMQKAKKPEDKTEAEKAAEFSKWLDEYNKKRKLILNNVEKLKKIGKP
jgi:hypothetical protein